ncbi:helix-turn-helix domain-containing protein [Treponema pedis]|uniref:Helix-turn-helix transcriptional regulator n=1 Tax=Treponema pedis TaxID=409322 RepID=A0A7S7AWW5_9SPIR|nr:AraC family transcriptional regulator [Treponema pedis]QOW61372.1 helix-turn-helix transcriptional regulator [Treponema pedis]QSI04626.1 AraC family transcriptional regulator [Treponema pedis]
MRTLEDYWADFERYGFIKHIQNGRIDYRLPEEKGSGGFSVLGDSESAMAVVSDCTLFTPFIIKEHVDELILEAGHYYTGSASYYQKEESRFEFEYGLNAYVNYPVFDGYKRIEPNIRLVNAGFAFRKKFFDTLPIKLHEDFFEKAAEALNPAPITIPQLSLICNQLKECTLEGAALRLFIHGKAYEAFALLYDYIYSKPLKCAVYLSPQDKSVLNEVKKYIELHFAEDFTIAELTKRFALNQQKTVTGFKELFHTTINGYTKKMRMTKALELLHKTDLSIIAVAQAVGYYGDGFFQKAFKETYGITPNKMRKELKN